MDARNRALGASDGNECVDCSAEMAIYFAYAQSF
jgi:hypothetical protein